MINPFAQVWTTHLRKPPLGQSCSPSLGRGRWRAERRSRRPPTPPLQRLLRSRFAFHPLRACRAAHRALRPSCTILPALSNRDAVATAPRPVFIGLCNPWWIDSMEPISLGYARPDLVPEERVPARLEGLRLAPPSPAAILRDASVAQCCSG